MRKFEFGLLVSLIMFIVTQHTSLLILCSLVFVLNLSKEKHRWQMWGVYLVGFIEAVTWWSYPGASSTFRLCVELVIIVISGLTAFMLPVPSFPPVSHLPIGTVTLSWQIEQKTKTWEFSKEFYQYSRQLVVKVWYPAEQATNSDSHVRKMFTGPKSAIARYLHFIPDSLQFSLLSDYLHLTTVHARYGAPLSNNKGKWPVLLFSHGQGCFPEDYTMLCEQIASCGFVVVAIYHEDLDSRHPGTTRRRRKDVQFVLEQLVVMNTQKNGSFSEWHSKDQPNYNRFYQRLELSQGVGLFGHSFGASTTVLLSQPPTRDDIEFEKEEGFGYNSNKELSAKISACVAMDTWMFPIPQDSNRKILVPLLLINSDMWLIKPDDVSKLSTFYHAPSHKGVYAVTMKGTSHHNFMDLIYLLSISHRGFIWPSKILTEGMDGQTQLLGPADGRQVLETVYKLIASFFSLNLNAPNESINNNDSLVFSPPSSPLYKFQAFPPQ